MLAAAVALAAVVPVVSTANASAAPELPLSGFGDVVVDDVHERVFVSGGASSNGVVVADFSGRVRKTITGQPGANGLELSADGTRLYVALSAGDGISVIDTATLTETGRYSTGAGTCPTHLARTGTLIWFGYGCADENWTGKIGRLDPAAAEPVTRDQQGAVRFQRAPLLASSGAETGPLVAGQLSLSLSQVQVYSVAERALTAGASGEVVGASLTDLDVTGDTLFSAAGGRDRVEAFATGDLARRGAYATRPRASAVSVSPNGGFVAAAALTTDGNDVLVYEMGGVVPVNVVSLDSGETAFPRGLAWSAEQEYLFIVTRHDNEPEPHLEIERDPTDG